MDLKGFCGPSGESRSTRIACDRTINLYLDEVPNEQRLVLYSMPGLRPVAVLPSAPVRALYTTTTGRTFAVTSTELYEVFSGWTYVLRGTVPTGTQQASLTDNGQQMVLSVEGQGLLYDLATNTLTPIVHGEPTVVWGRVQYISGYFIVHAVGTTRFYYSNVFNGAVWDALAYYGAEARGDPLMTVYVDHNELWLPGTQTTEIWYVTGDSLNPFARAGAQFIEQGTVAPWSFCGLDNTVFWLGGSPRGEGPAYRAQGYQPVRISNRSVEMVRATIQTVGSAIAMTARQGGHAWYMLHWPDTETTWAYDLLTQAWTELATLNPDGSLSPWPVNQHCLAFDVHLWGSYTDGALYVWDPGYHYYGLAARYCARIGPWVRDDASNARMTFSSLTLRCETGHGLDGGVVPGHDPQYRLAWTADGERWSYEHWRSAGKLGARERRVVWRQLGQDRARAFRVASTEPIQHAWHGVTLNEG